MSINTMTLGGLAIAIGGLVDDAVVGVENVLRRLKEDRAKHHDHRMHPIELVAHATMEVRSAILYATIIIVLVFLPLAWAMRRSWFYRRAVLLGGSLLIAALAAVWLAERVVEVKLLPW